MRTLGDLYHEGGEAKHFAEEFVHTVHGGDWPKAKDHWTLILEHISHNVRELDQLKPPERESRAEAIGRAVCLSLAQIPSCWACRHLEGS